MTGIILLSRYGEELVANIILDIEEKLTKEVHADQVSLISFC